MKEIKLQNSDLIAFIDDDSYEKLINYKWYKMQNRNNIYAISFIVTNGKRKTILMHRMVLPWASQNMDIDHIDRNGLNNQRNNLRVVSHSENLANSRNRGESFRVGISRIGLKKYMLFTIINEAKIDVGIFTLSEAKLLASQIRASIRQKK